MKLSKKKKEKKKNIRTQALKHQLSDLQKGYLREVANRSIIDFFTQGYDDTKLNDKFMTSSKPVEM